MKFSWFILAIALLVSPSVFAQQNPSQGLVLRGRVREMKLVPSDPKYVRLEVAVDIEFVNTATKPIIFLKPQQEHEADIFWAGGITLSVTRALANSNEANSTIWALGYWPSNYISPEYREMTMRLNQPSLPPDLMQVLQPNESWTWQTTALLPFYAKPTRSIFSHNDLPWEQIRNIQAPLWMRLEYNVWSVNLIRPDKGLRKRLRKRWSKLGTLNIEPFLTTEPIELDLRRFAVNVR